MCFYPSTAMSAFLKEVHLLRINDLIDEGDAASCWSSHAIWVTALSTLRHASYDVMRCVHFWVVFKAPRPSRLLVLSSRTIVSMLT